MFSSIRCILVGLLFTACVYPLAGTAQSKLNIFGVSVRTDTDGGLFSPPRDISQDNFDELTDLLGLPPAGGTASTEQICAAVIAQIPTSLLPVANIGNFLGLCKSSACRPQPL
jgi:hypothetical protein